MSGDFLFFPPSLHEQSSSVHSFLRPPFVHSSHGPSLQGLRVRSFPNAAAVAAARLEGVTVLKVRSLVAQRPSASSTSPIGERN
jgi:hypothetical protein